MTRRSKMSRAILLACSMMAVGAAFLDAKATAVASQKSRSNPAPPSTVAVRAVLDKYCVTCHNQRVKTAGLMLDTLDVEHAGSAADQWEKVARKFRTQEMPPPGRPRPDSDTYRAATLQIETALDNAAAAKPNPGRVAVHRLNRVEYTNAIRDLLGLEVDSRSLLPAELRQHGEYPLSLACSARGLPVRRVEGQSSRPWRSRNGSSRRHLSNS